MPSVFFKGRERKRKKNLIDISLHPTIVAMLRPTKKKMPWQFHQYNMEIF
jgi:hypothetical protein